jgi:hypothetical protein
LVTPVKGTDADHLVPGHDFKFVADREITLRICDPGVSIDNGLQRIEKADHVTSVSFSLVIFSSLSFFSVELFPRL